MVRTNIEIDNDLIIEAKKLGKLKTKKDIINEALHLYVARLRRMQMLELRGKVIWEGNLDEMRES